MAVNIAQVDDDPTMKKVSMITKIIKTTTRNLRLAAVYRSAWLDEVEVEMDQLLVLVVMCSVARVLNAVRVQM